MTSLPATARSTLAGRYAIGDLLGRGGMGEVRSGWDKVLDRPVAIKVLRDDAASNRAVRRRFEAEAKAAARLVHPNIVQVFDSGEDDGVPFMVMEKLPGHSLRDDIRARKLSVSEATDMAAQVLAALDAAHAAGLVHRDIKPANILISEGGQWKVADFGIAKSLQPSGDETLTGLVLGTPAYLPPERLLGGAATPSGDLYALGVILYEALAGRKPFEATEPVGWVAATSTGPVPLRQLRPKVPPALAAVIERALSRDPGHRFNDARDMAVAMQTAKWEGGDEPAGWFAIAPAMPRGTNQVGADGRGAGATGVLLASALSADETDVMPVGGRAADPTDVMRAGETGRPRRLWLAGIGAGIAALLAATIALAAIGAPAKARTRTPPTTVAVQVPTTPPAPPTTVPVVKAPEPHHDSGPGKAGGDQGDHGG